MIKRVSFTRFRGFERLNAELLPHAIIVGPNSAGKSTVLEAIDLAVRCLKSVRRIPSEIRSLADGRRVRALPLPASIEFNDDPVRYDFGTAETRLTVEWTEGGAVNLVWPEESNGADNTPFFYLLDEGGTQPMSMKAISASFGTVTVVPVVTPLERNEDIKNPAYVEQRAGTRLASRHFRNHVWRMSQEGSWTEFKTFCAEWLTEISLLDVQFTATANRLAVFYQEAGSRVPKELAWAGDGVQIWVQLLWHIYRTQGAKTIVLDEPEVYLHPDLQRRLVRLLESTGAQIILASHSADVVAESPQEGLLWVDRRAGGARRLRTRQAISSLGVSLGSSYNLILARSMRARLVLGSDCEDLRVLRDLAKLIGAQHIANESDVSVVSVKRDTVLSAASAYVTSLREALPPNIPAGTLLAGALISPDVREAHIKASSQAGIKTVFHSRAAIENYLLVPEILARASGAGLDSMRERLNVACASLEDETRSAVIASWLGSRLVETKQQFAAAESAFSDAWNQRALRPNIVSANRVIDMLNESLEAEGYRTVTPRLLVRAAKPQELATDLFTCVFALDGQVH